MHEIYLAVARNIYIPCYALPFFLGFLVLYIWSIVWAYGDAEKRGKSGCLVALLVLLLSWPVGLIIWLIVRPEEKKPPPFDIEQYRKQ